MDCSLPGSSVHGILQARILEWAAIPFSRPREYCLGKTKKAQINISNLLPFVQKRRGM